MTRPAIADEIEIWYSDPASLEDPARWAAAFALLDCDERERLDRYHFERDRTLYLTGHALARRALSRHADVAPADWHFAAGRYGRPTVVAPTRMPSLQFNLAKTASLVACAVVRDREIGIDVEQIVDASPALIEECLAPGEIEQLRARPAPERGELFAIYWTLKESYIKARGFGLVLPVRRLAFELSDRASPCLTLDHLAGSADDPEALVDDDPACWTFVCLRPTPRHRAAVCVDHARDAPPPGVVEYWDP